MLLQLEHYDHGHLGIVRRKLKLDIVERWRAACDMKSRTSQTEKESWKVLHFGRSASAGCCA